MFYIPFLPFLLLSTTVVLKLMLITESLTIQKQLLTNFFYPALAELDTIPNIPTENISLHDSVPCSSNSAYFHNSPIPTNHLKLTAKNNQKTKAVIAKNIYEGLADLNKQRMEKTEEMKQIKGELYELKLKKAKFKLEISEQKRNLMAKRVKYETDVMESEVRQNNIKEQILLLELKHKKKC